MYILRKYIYLLYYIKSYLYTEHCHDLLSRCVCGVTYASIIDCSSQSWSHDVLTLLELCTRHKRRFICGRYTTSRMNGRPNLRLGIWLRVINCIFVRWVLWVWAAVLISPRDVSCWRTGSGQSHTFIEFEKNRLNGIRKTPSLRKSLAERIG